jgi:mannitol/fructose-specific phosphotransferase system IIA component
MIERRRQFNLNLTEDEYAMCKLLAEEQGITVSDFVRKLIRREHEVSEYLTPLQIDAALCLAGRK